MAAAAAARAAVAPFVVVVEEVEPPLAVAEAGTDWPWPSCPRCEPFRQDAFD